MVKNAIIIPARMASTRFPNKPLAIINGITMIERVWRIAKQVPNTIPYVATDSLILKKHAESFQAKVIMTSPDCYNGTERVADALKYLPMEIEIIINLQGDAVLTPPIIIKEILTTLQENEQIKIATPAVLLQGKALTDFVANKKKGSTTGTCVVFSKTMQALYFSKQVLPYSRDNNIKQVYQHIGLYGYRREALLEFKELPIGNLEKIEQLEQLRALENNLPIHVVEVNCAEQAFGSVDNPEDVVRIENIIATEEKVN